MDFFGSLLSLLLLTVTFNQLREIREKLNTIGTGYEYAVPQYEQNFNLIPEHSAALLEDDAPISTATEDITFDYYNLHVTNEQIQLDPTETVPTEMEVIPRGDVKLPFTTEKIELEGTPNELANINTTVANETSVKQIENSTISTEIIMIKFFSFVLSVISAVLLITALLILFKKIELQFTHLANTEYYAEDSV